MGRTYYDDCGHVYEFMVVTDDLWKKDEVFTMFATRLIRMIGLEVGVPLEYLGWGKWGGRIYIFNEYAEEHFEEWASAIENHHAYQQFREVCGFAVARKEGPEADETIFTYLDIIEYLQACRLQVERGADLDQLLDQARTRLSRDDYVRFLTAFARTTIRAVEFLH